MMKLWWLVADVPEVEPGRVGAGNEEVDHGSVTPVEEVT